MLLAMKLKVGFAVAALASPVAMTTMAPPRQAPTMAEFTEVAVTSYAYRAAGDFSREGRPTVAPLRQLHPDSSLAIMTSQVTAAQYARCVEDSGCPRVSQASRRNDLPMVGVSWRDATAYARWMTKTTGKLHRLPTDEEWVFAAGEKASDDGLIGSGPTTDAVKSWIARYDAEASRARPAFEPQPTGAFGHNRNGLKDIAGNVWEWTDTCFTRGTVDATGIVLVTNTNCGVRVVEGAHRAYMTDFIRDPRSGGCAAGMPPTNLGFRLVIEREKRFDLRRIAKRIGDRIFRLL
jgi:formylglycine-generating enzyme required for sulfatase activity